MTTIHLFFAMASTHHWSLHQLDIKNVSLHGDLEKEVYMKQPLRFVAPGSLVRSVSCVALFMASKNNHMLGLVNLAQ